MATSKRPARAAKPDPTPAPAPVAKAKPAPRQAPAAAKPKHVPAPGPGRPSIISPAIEAELMRALTAGAFVETACDFAGIHKDTFYAWIKRGAAERGRRERFGPLDAVKGRELDREIERRKGEEPFLRFSDAVKRAQADNEVGLLATITKASKETWQAGAWILERKFPDKYGARRKVLVEIASEVRKQLDKGLDKLEQAVERGELDADSYEAVLAILSELEGPEGGGIDLTEGGVG